MTPESGYGVEEVDALDCVHERVPWRFAQDYRDAIDTAWASALAARPQMFNGRVLMLTRGEVRHQTGRATFHGAYTEVEFKAFLAWRDLGRPVQDLRNGFGMAALQAEDGAFLLGEMGPHTANAGLVYFPSGTPDPGDIVGEAVDIAGSIGRELVEETGLDAAGLLFEPGFTLIHDPFRVCIMQRVRAPGSAETLAARIHEALARQAQPELVRMHIVRSPADITSAMPPFVALYLRRAFAEADQPG